MIELDGGQHTPEKDQQRTEFFTNYGAVVLRFWNNEVLENMDGVLDRILEVIKERPSL